MRSAAATVVALTLAGPALAGSVAIGDKRTPFALKNYDGKDVDLKSFQGSTAVVLMFIATQCPVSNAYNERMAGLAKDYAAKGVTFVGINANRQESAAEVAEHSKKHGFTFDVLKDTDNVQADKFGAAVTPEIYVYDPAWTLRYHGRIDDNQRGDNIKSQDLKVALDSLLAGKDVPVKETKAFGCTIKRVSP